MIKFTFHMKTYQIYKEFSRLTCSAAFYIVCDNFSCTDRYLKDLLRYPNGRCYNYSHKKKAAPPPANIYSTWVASNLKPQ